MGLMEMDQVAVRHDLMVRVRVKEPGALQELRDFLKNVGPLYMHSLYINDGYEWENVTIRELEGLNAVDFVTLGFSN